jgi:hypothetical protein
LYSALAGVFRRFLDTEVACEKAAIPTNKAKDRSNNFLMIALVLLIRHSGL